MKHLTTSKALKDAILEQGAAFTPETKKKIRKFEDARKQKLFLGLTSYNDRFREMLDRFTSLEKEVPELLDDTQYDLDVLNCEKYIESAKRAIMWTSRHMVGLLVPSTKNDTITDAHEAAATTAPTSPSTTLRLPQSST